MTEDSLPLAELLAKAGDSDFLRSVAEAVVQLLMETDAEGLIGAGRHERTAERQTYRNGYRDRAYDKDHDRPEIGRRAQHRHDLRLEDIGQRVGTASLPGHALGRRQARVVLESLQAVAMLIPARAAAAGTGE